MTLYNVALTAIANVDGTNEKDAERRASELLRQHGFEVLSEHETFESEEGTEPSELS